MTDTNNDFVGVLEADLNGQDLRIGVVQARLMKTIVLRLQTLALVNSSH